MIKSNRYFLRGRLLPATYNNIPMSFHLSFLILSIAFSTPYSLGLCTLPPSVHRDDSSFKYKNVGSDYAIATTTLRRPSHRVLKSLAHIASTFLSPRTTFNLNSSSFTFLPKAPSSTISLLTAL